MSSNRRLIIGAFFLLVPALVTVIACQSYALGNMAARPTAVGSVDINKAFDGLNERADIDATLNSMADELQTEAERLADQIDELQEEVEAHVVGSDKHQATLEELQLKSLEYQAFVEFSKRKIDVHKALELKRLFEVIQKEVEILALEMGYDIVVIDDSVASIGGGSEADVRLQILARQVLYANNEVDITPVLIERMNQP